MRASASERIFRGLLRLFPHHFRIRFGEEMNDVFGDQLLAAHRDGGRLGVFRLWLRTAPALVRAALLERGEAYSSTAVERERGPVLETFIADLRLAARMLSKSPLFAFVAVLCLALGAGAVTTIFSTMNALVLRPLPGTRDGASLVRIERKRPGGDDGVSLSYPWYRQVQQRARTLDGVVAWGKLSLVLRNGTDPGDAIYGQAVSGNLFAVLGIRPRLGRFFAPDEDRTELTHPVLVVSERYWRARLGGDSTAVGGDILVNGQAFTLIGVAPGDFEGMDTPIRTDAWVPLSMQRALRGHAGPLSDPSAIWLRMAARLRPAAGRATARQELATLGQALIAENPGDPWHHYSELRVSPLTGLPPDATETLSRFLGLLLGAAALVLIIASVNVGGMLSARAVGRRREMAVRAALGASRGRLVRQLLTEILLLFSLGAAGGWLIALGATRALERLPIPSDKPIRLLLAPDLRVLAFALLVSLVTGLVVGLAPTRQALGRDVSARLRDGSNASTGARTFAGNALIVAQLAVSLVLLVGAGLLGRGLLRATRIDPGFEVKGVAAVPLDVEAWGYDEARGRRFYRELEERVAGIPGVTAVSSTTILPLNFHSSGDEIELIGSLAGTEGNKVPIQQNLVGPDYFSVLRIPLTEGRPIGREDDERNSAVAVINQTMARRFWQNGGALGRTFRYHGRPVTVVGIARDARYASLTEATPALAYFPFAQEWRAQQTLLVRAEGDPRVIASTLSRVIHETDRNAPRSIVLPLTDAIGVALLPGKVATLVTGVLGLVGLLLSITGLYGVVAYSAARRTREIGIRLALGARSGDVLRLVVRDGARLTLCGIAVGLLLAALGARLLSSLLFGMSPLDPAAYVLMPVLLGAVAMLASYLPARRAAATEPWVVLKAE